MFASLIFSIGLAMWIFSFAMRSFLVLVAYKSPYINIQQMMNSNKYCDFSWVGLVGILLAVAAELA